MKKAIFIFLTLIFILNITPVLADDDFERECKTGLFGGGDVCYKPEVAIPGFPDYEFKVKSNTLGLYINSLYDYFLYAAGVLAVIVIMIAGFQWITAGGNQSKIGEAKERITSAIIGLFLALGSYLLLFTINPDLVNIVDLNMKEIESVELSNSYYDLSQQCFNKGGYVYSWGSTTCKCDNAGIKENYKFYGDLNYCCVCNGCPHSGVALGNSPSCDDLCKSKGCNYGNPWSPTLRSCCSCQGCPDSPEVLQADPGCVDNIHGSCVVSKVRIVGDQIGDNGYCNDQNHCFSCLSIDVECSAAYQCKNYPPNWDGDSSNVFCGSDNIDNTMKCSRQYIGAFGPLKCKDSDF